MPLDFSSARISHYLVHDELGRDALGFTLRATDESLDRPVALRVLRAVDFFPPDQVAAVRERFRQDAQHAARLSHPNLVTLYAFQRLGDMDLIAMELVEGETLEQRMQSGRRWSVIEAARMGARIADALAVAHAAGLVHGRLNPGNIVIRGDGRVKVLDLGIPKAPPDAYPMLDWGVDPARPETAAAAQPTPAADVAAVGAMIRRMVLGPDPDALEAADPSADHSLARIIAERAEFGILQPAIEGAAVAGTDGGFADAGELRDALLEAVRAATDRIPAAATPDAREAASSDTPRPRVIVPPPRPPLTSAPAAFDSDGEALDVLGRLPGEADAPRLALPADLSRGAHLPRSGSYIVLTNATLADRVRGAMLPIVDRLGAVGSGRLIAGGLIVSVLLAAALVFQRRSASDAFMIVPPDPADPSVSSQAPPKPPAGESPAVVAMADTTLGAPVTAADTIAPAPGAAAPDFSLTAAVRGSPDGTRIAVVGDDARAWTDRTDLTVSPGDSLIVEFSHPGYIGQRRAFKGSRLAVSLVPDSVVASFEANIPADVFLFSPPSAATPRRIGTTNMAIRLPTGRFRVLYRAPGQPDWVETHAMTTPGGRYTIAKNDYASQGDLIVTVSGAWGLVSVDGGTPRETPYKFTGLNVGSHVVRISRDGFQSIVDTVVVAPAGTTTRQYTLRR